MKRTALGFTLIELLVSVGIGLILVVGGLAAYKGVGAKQSVKQAGVTFKTNLRSFQQKSLSGEKPVSCSSLQGYVISYVSEDSYSVQANCLSGSGDINVFTLDNGVEFMSGFGDIEFLTLETAIVGAPFLVDLSVPSSGYVYQVIVDSSGVISGLML